MKRKSAISLLAATVIISAGYVLYLHSDPAIKVSDSKDQFTTDDISTKNNQDIDINEIHYLENIPVVYINGTGYNAGLHHGKLLKQQIKEVIDILNSEILKIDTVKGFVINTYLLQKAKQIDKHIPQIYREEMKGVADGAQVSYNNLLILNTYDDLLYLTGCSSIAISKNDRNSFFFHARNLDYPVAALSDKNIVFHYLDSDFISVGFPGYIGAVSATNYSGISLSSHTVAVPKNEIGVPTGIIYREIMEKASTINEAETILKANPRTIGNNILVSSLAENQTIVFEITSDQIIKVSDTGHSVATNHFVSPELSTINNATPSSQGRYTYLDTFYTNVESPNIDQIKEAMSFYDGNQIGWSSVANKGTVQSVIFLPEQKIIWIAKGVDTPVNQAGYVQYHYSQFVSK